MNDILAYYTLAVALAFHINLVTYPGKESLWIPFGLSLFWWFQAGLWCYGTFLEWLQKPIKLNK